MILLCNVGMNTREKVLQEPAFSSYTGARSHWVGVNTASRELPQVEDNPRQQQQQQFAARGRSLQRFLSR